MEKMSRSESARKAAYAMHAKHDAKETTAEARATFMARFQSEDEVREYFSRIGKVGGSAPRTRHGRRSRTE